MAYLLLRADGTDHTVNFEGTGEELLIEYAILTGQLLAGVHVSRETFLNWIRSLEFEEVINIMHDMRKEGRHEKTRSRNHRRRSVKRRKV